MQTTSWLAEWDLAALGHTAPHDDESYLNSAFLLQPPTVSLGGHYIYPEPPADRAWNLRGIAWSEAFPPRILNLGARKWFQKESRSSREYRVDKDAIKPLELLMATHWPNDAASASGYLALASPVPSTAPSLAKSLPAAVAVCAPLSGTARQRAAWVHSLSKSVRLWHAHNAEIVVIDTGLPVSSASDAAPAMDGASAARYQHFSDAGGRQSGVNSRSAVNCPLPALQLLLSLVRTHTVLLLDTASLLTWQANVHFLQSLAAPGQTALGSEAASFVGNGSFGHGNVDGRSGDKKEEDASYAENYKGDERPTIVLACPRPAGAQEPLGGSLAGADGDFRCLSPPGAVLRGRLGLPPHNCSPCESMQLERLARERRGEAPFIVRMTPMRKLTCWRLPAIGTNGQRRYHHHAMSVLRTSLARELVEAVASVDDRESTVAIAGFPCGIDCWLGRGSSARQRQNTGLPPLRFLSCIPDMRPLLRLDIP